MPDHPLSKILPSFDIHSYHAGINMFLDERDIPREWYNLAADLPTPDAPFLS